MRFDTALIIISLGNSSATMYSFFTIYWSEAEPLWLGDLWILGIGGFVFCFYWCGGDDGDDAFRGDWSTFVLLFHPGLFPYGLEIVILDYFMWLDEDTKWVGMSTCAFEIVPIRWE